MMTAIGTAVFSSVVSAAYTIAGAECPPIVNVFILMAPTISVVLWLQKDVARTGVGRVHDWGYFLLLASRRCSWHSRFGISQAAHDWVCVR
jgi:hypothetical protein